MSHSSGNSYREQDQFEEIEHVVTIEKKNPESNAKYMISNPKGNSRCLFPIPHYSSLSPPVSLALYAPRLPCPLTQTFKSSKRSN